MGDMNVFDSNLRIVTVKQFASLPPYSGFLSEAAIRQLIFYAEPRYSASGESVPGNGLAEAGAIIRTGRKVLLNLDGFDAWLLSHTFKPNTGKQIPSTL